MKTYLALINSWLLWVIAPGVPSLACVGLLSAIALVLSSQLACAECGTTDETKFNAYCGMACAAAGNCAFSLILGINWEWVSHAPNICLFYGATTSFGVVVFLLMQRRWTGLDRT